MGEGTGSKVTGADRIHYNASSGAQKNGFLAGLNQPGGSQIGKAVRDAANTKVQKVVQGNDDKGKGEAVDIFGDNAPNTLGKSFSAGGKNCGFASMTEKQPSSFVRSSPDWRYGMYWRRWNETSKRASSQVEGRHWSVLTDSDWKKVGIAFLILVGLIGVGLIVYKVSAHHLANGNGPNGGKPPVHTGGGGSGSGGNGGGGPPVHGGGGNGGGSNPFQPTQPASSPTHPGNGGQGIFGWGSGGN